MNVEDLRINCLAKPGVTEEFPFDDTTLVFKVLGRIFVILGLEDEESRINLKSCPEEAIVLREEYADIIPGYHMNKKHWNTVYIERSLPDEFITSLIDQSYKLVVQKLTKKDKEYLQKLSG